MGKTNQEGEVGHACMGHMHKGRKEKCMHADIAH